MTIKSDRMLVAFLANQARVNNPAVGVSKPYRIGRTTIVTGSLQNGDGFRIEVPTIGEPLISVDEGIYRAKPKGEITGPASEWKPPLIRRASTR